MNVNKLVDIATFSPSSLKFPNSWVGHLPFAAWLIQEVSPKIFVELGTHSGNSYFSFCQSVVEAELSTQCFAIDTWYGDEHSENYDERIFAEVSKENEEKYAGFSHLLRMTFDVALASFADESIELLHIDGLHTYEAVSHDFETWLPKLAPGAVVLFHDTQVRERNFGVWKLWGQLQAIYPNNLEFVHSHGLGVLQLNNASDDKKLSWLEPSSPEKQNLINYFAALGTRQLERYEITEIKERFSDLNQHVTNLNQCLADSIAERDGHIANLSKDVGMLNQAVSDRDGMIGILKQKLNKRNKKVAELYASTSWRVTRPVRFLGYQIKRVKRAKELAIPAIKLGGGITNTVLKAVKLYRKEGLSGIKRGLGLVAKSVQPIQKKTFDESGRNNYAEWVRRYDTVTDETRIVFRKRIDDFLHQPMISLVMPVYNPKPEWLIEAIDSVCNQIYPNWEFCIADDASTDSKIRSILENYAKKEPRIKVAFREQNGHISAASNSALELVTGEWVALLDHDDLLSEHALFWVVEAICQNPDTSLIYSDEDKIDEKGERFSPYFKSDWNLDLFYSHNMFSHLGVYRADLLKAIGGLRVGFEGSQDYDLALRCIERIKPKQIHHIPRVLYHWRVHDESTSKTLSSKPYAMLAGEKALNEHFQRQKTNAVVELLGFGFRVRYALPEPLPLVSLIIPTRNGYELIHQCVDSILKKTTYPNYEILIIDNGSDEPATIKYLNDLKNESQVKVIRDDRPFNYSALNNAAVKLARGEVIGLLNNDLEVIAPEWLTEMVSIALQPSVGAVGARLWYPNNTLQHGGVILGLGGVAGHSHKHLPQRHIGYVGRAIFIQGFSAVTGACLVIQKSIYDEVNGLNETELKVAFNDVDFCLRVKAAGYRNVWTPYAELYHHESATRGSENTPEKQARFVSEVEYMMQSWGDKLTKDPAYSPNLSLEYDDFSYAWPPRVELFPSEPTVAMTNLNRVEKTLFMIDKHGLGLEIGPSHNPIAPKREGFNVHVLDHATADHLREKYKGHEIYGVKLENIEDVDFVWQGESFQELIGKTHCYDWIIASHVIEHIPDFVSFLQQCNALLKPTGILSLVIPDKRFCFDYFSASNSTGDLLDAYTEKRVKPSHGQIFDHFANAAKLNGNIAWSSEMTGTANELIHEFSQAQETYYHSLVSPDYIDAHCWRFTPASFRLLISDLQSLDLINLEIKTEFDTEGCEFFVSLGMKGDIPVKLDRLKALKARKDENN